MNIQEIAERAHKNAVNRGFYNDDAETAIKDKLIEEVDELEQALYCNDYREFPKLAKDNEKFRVAFEMYIKDSVGGEIADIIITALAASVELGIPIEDYLSACLRHNEIRKYHD